MQVELIETDTVKERWFLPQTVSGEYVILYLHGGGYAFLFVHMMT